jgi:uncharacterized protein (DUF427 family)
MSTQVHDLLANGIGQLRHEPTTKRVRATLGGGTVVDSTRAALVWEPRRIVPSYAVPAADIHGEIAPAATPAAGAAEGAGSRLPDVFAKPVLDPSVPFTAHTADGEAVDVSANGQRREPLTDASRVGGLIAFFNERVDAVIDGERRERPITPWSPRTQ